MLKGMYKRNETCTKTSDGAKGNKGRTKPQIGEVGHGAQPDH